MTSAEQEIAILDTIVPRLRAEGYEVFVHPSAQMLPPFMGRYTPDAIALKSGRRLAIELVRDDPSSQSKLGHARRLFEGKSDWELLVYWVSNSDVAPDINMSDLRSVEASIHEVEALVDQGYGASALLLAWATLEAAARTLSPKQLARPQNASSLIEALASDGFVTPGEADGLRSISKLRNFVAHGDLSAHVHLDQVRELISITRTMMSEARPTTQVSMS